MRREVKWAAWAAGGLLALYVIGPLWAGWSLRQAMRNRDSAALETRVDWLTLRRNLKPRVAQSLRDEADKSGLLGGLIKRTLGGSISDAAVETLVTPANLARLLAGRAFVLDKLPSLPGSKPPPPDPDPEDADDPMPPRRLRWAFFESPTRFRVEAVHPRLPGSRIVSILELQGLGWKLIDVDIIKK